jgi:hypothetical protein
MNLGKLLGAGKSFKSGQNAAAYRPDKRVYLPQFVSPKNPFANSPATAEPPMPAASSAAPAMKTSATARATTWTARLNPVAMFRDATAPAKNFAPPVQVELSLEKVKVVHNDLADADVEVVPMKSRPAREAEKPPAKKSWADLGERIMKATAL